MQPTTGGYQPSMLPALSVFVTVARTLSFARAADELRISSTAVSKTIKQLEAGLGTRLLNRTTRSVSLTDAGSQLLSAIQPAFASVENAIEQVRSDYDQPSGELRVNTSHVGYVSLIEPHLPDFLKLYPALSVEISIDNVLSDIVGAGFDVGVRLGHTVQQDMVGIPLGERQQRVVVASPEYLAEYGAPLEPQDLIRHKCIRQRLHARGQFYEWVFRVNDRNQQINVDSNVIYDEMRAAVSAALNGVGLAYVFKQFAEQEIAKGRLRVVLETFSPSGEPFFLYYPHRTQMPAKLRVFVDFFKEKCS
ncbi:LysR family transcriptional regulator [Pseudomonas viridiflava]|uniref:LysR family transcriptional regulator n=1 Tax=Pseudomonas viridiflava TaxID=33069 RepID=A0ABU7NC76_PSEVI|nr:LysR family transcriptional regulator [Pseudomonas viridiflava]MEE4042529.1 LysR family transcriptional regulator [Pseudomonas viridiflava]MEE4062499.1 LysR family transcriptional regulator [Pseudomonas viridiflava]MEE4171879.1 LysR family transcriptional regulator [Pseudomonas viridiflava]